MKRHRGASIMRLIAHKRGLVGDEDGVMFPYLTLTEMVGDICCNSVGSVRPIVL